MRRWVCLSLSATQDGATGKFPLHHSAGFHHLDAINALVTAGAKPNRLVCVRVSQCMCVCTYVCFGLDFVSAHTV